MKLLVMMIYTDFQIAFEIQSFTQRTTQANKNIQEKYVLSFHHMEL